MPRPQKRVHIPLDFKEALTDLLKVEPEPERDQKSKKKPAKKKRARPQEGE